VVEFGPAQMAHRWCSGFQPTGHGHGHGHCHGHGPVMDNPARRVQPGAVPRCTWPCTPTRPVLRAARC
jgi:hypothetical protein